MTKTEFERISAVRGVTQIGFLVNDIFCTMDHWCEEHGVGPWKLYRHTRDRLQNVVCQEGICEEDFCLLYRQRDVGGSPTGSHAADLWHPVLFRLARRERARPASL